MRDVFTRAHGEVIGALARALATELELTRVLEVALDSLVHVMAPGRIAVFLVDEGGGALRLAAQRGMARETADRVAHIPLGDSALLASRAVALHTPQFVADTGALPSEEGRVWESKDFGGQGSAWAIPLEVHHQVVGALEGCLADSTAWSDDERALLHVIGDVVAVAVAGARSRAKARTHRAQLGEVQRAGLAIADAMAILPEAHLRAAVDRGFQVWTVGQEEGLPEFLTSVLQEIVDRACATAGAKFAALGIGDYPDQPFEPWVMTGVDSNVVAAIGRHPRPIGTLGVVARDGQVVRVRRVSEHPSFIGLPPHHPAITSLLGVPIRYGNKSLGNLYLGNKLDADEFTLEDQQAIELLASQAAVALQQTYLRALVETQRSQTHAILESAPHGLIFIDAGMEHVTANPRAMQMLGRRLQHGAGPAQYVELLRHPDGRHIALEDHVSAAALRGEEPQSTEILIERPDGRSVPVLESAAPVRGIGNKIIGVVVTLEDISPLKELERLREDIAAMVAHDLRNPIQAIRLQLEVLARRKVDEDVRAALNRIDNNAAALQRMAQDLVLTTRLELRRLELVPTTVDLAQATAIIIERLRPVSGERRLELVTEGTLPMVDLDLDRLDQIVTNLMENAIHFSPVDEPIVVRVAPSKGGAELSVRDRGSGISPEDLPHVFERFWRAKRDREGPKGLGLGLYITKGLVEAHGGRITVESESGRGSTFRAWFPPAKSAPAATEIPPAA